MRDFSSYIRECMLNANVPVRERRFYASISHKPEQEIDSSPPLRHARTPNEPWTHGVKNASQSPLKPPVNYFRAKAG